MKTAVVDLGRVGYIADVEPQRLPPNAWSFLQNARCVDGSIGAFAGHSSIATISGLVETIVEVKTGTLTYITYGAGDTIYSLLGGTETSIATGFALGGKWDSTTLGGVGVYTNGVPGDNPYYWGGAGAALPLPYDSTGTTTCYWTDVGLSAKIIRAFKQHLIAMNIVDCEGENSRLIYISDPADPGTVPVTFDPNNADFLANRFELVETPGAILDGLPLRDTFQIYTDDSIHSLTYTGRYSPTEFSWNRRLVTDATGIYSRDCVVDIGGQHVFVGDGDVYLYDGNTPREIADERVKDLLFNSISRSQKDLIFCSYYERTGEVFINYPSQGATACDRALVWNKKDDTWSERAMPDCTAAAFLVVDRGTEFPWTYFQAGGDTWADVQTAGGIDLGDGLLQNWNEVVEDSPFKESLVVAGSTDLYEMDVGNTADGTNLECIVRRTHLDLGDKQDWHMVKALYIRASGDPFNVRLGSQDLVTGAVTWSPAQVFTPGTDYKLNFAPVTGRLHAIEFNSTADVSWKVEAYEVEYEFVGSY